MTEKEKIKESELGTVDRSRLSPMMQQYLSVKDDYDDCLVMFRLGDFYELFFDDAKTASRELELTLTGRACGLKERAPMCGVPYHAADQYITALVEKGYKVAICEQMEDPATAKGIVKRDVIRVITPGTLDLSGSAAADENVYIASLYKYEGRIAIAYADITTGELTASEVDAGYGGTGYRGRQIKRSGSTAPDLSELISELTRISPREIILTEDLADEIGNIFDEHLISTYVNRLDSSYYKHETCEKAILAQFNTKSVMPLGLDGRTGMITAVGSLLLYLIDTQKQDPSQITHLEISDPKDHMSLDRSTMRNLELLETLYDKKVKGSLLGVLDRTKTAMGGRLLRRYIKEPLNDPDRINRRLDAVDALLQEPLIRDSITAELRHIYDFERLTARIASGRANAKDLVALRGTLGALPELNGLLDTLIDDNNLSSDSLIAEIRSKTDDFMELHDLIASAITDEPPFLLTEGGLIRSGYSEELDSIKDSIRDAKEWIANLEVHEKERTGIKTLKVGYNKVFGYYIDVSKTQTDKVPDDYIRKQTLVNNERYITPELKEKENAVMSAESRINSMEYEIFKDIRTRIQPYIGDLQQASQAVAVLDVLVSFAETASLNNYVKPEVDDSYILDIKGGRHPAVENLLGDGMFVANDTEMDQQGKSMLIITGPNMSGKSTYMRQTAIIVLMAQIGSFVPAESAHIGVVDRVFTRIGASDNLAYGQSTFYVEMSELANILRNASGRSLIILDEIGRGTSTFDGLSIAWATVEYLCSEEHRVRTMFATHYHELTVLEDDYDCIKNLSVAVSDDGDNVVFLHKIAEGPASKSYGIHVAKIAGVPNEVRKEANRKLRELESGSTGGKGPGVTDAQISLFDELEAKQQAFDEEQRGSEEADRILEELRSADVNNMTPLQALVKLQELQSEAESLL